MPKNKSITLKVKVTAEDIRLGCPEDAENCPVARAVLRAVARELNKSRVGRLLAESLTAEVDCDSVVIQFGWDSTPEIQLTQAKEHVSGFVISFDQLPGLQDELADEVDELKHVRKYGDQDAIFDAEESIADLRTQIKACKAKIKPFSFFLTLS